jgi:aldehyde dehydrogenase (NAD+)
MTRAIPNRGLLIGGAEMPAVSGATFDVLSPSTREVVGTVARAGAADVDAAVLSAREGFARWQALTPAGREAILLDAANGFGARADDFVELLIDESGSTISKAGFEVAYTRDLFRTAAGEARRLYGDTFPNDRNDRLSMVFREPLGIVAVISPFNAPLALTAKMSAFPLAAGNSIVLKPSEETPLIALELAAVLEAAGMPAGVVNVLTGLGAECGAPLAAHPGVDGIAFTGSTATGIAIGEAANATMKRTQLELGGKSAVLVLADVEPEAAAAIVRDGMFAHAGQICMANSRIVVEEAVYDAFKAALKAALEAMPIGDLRNPATAYGPLINEAALEKVERHQADALARGASLLTGGRVREGLVYEPTVLVEPDRDSEVWRDESFGPIASLVKAADLDDAIATANDSDFGLSAAVLTQDVRSAFEAARRIRAGSVHIGMHAFQSNALAPIGGFGLSGIGKSGGHYSTEEFTEQKWVSIELARSS